MLIFLALQIKKMCNNFFHIIKKSQLLKYKNIITKKVIIKSLINIKKTYFYVVFIILVLLNKIIFCLT